MTSTGDRSLTRREVLRRAAGRQPSPWRPGPNWRRLLPRRQRDQLRAAESYAQRFPAGAPALGPQRLLLIAELAAMLDRAVGATIRDPPD